MYQLFSLYLVDWILPNPEKDTPLRWTVRLVLGGLSGVILFALSK